MLDHRRRRWSNIKTTLDQRLIYPVTPEWRGMVGKSEPGAMVCSPPDTICGPLTHRAIFRPLYTQSRSATLPSHWSATQTGVVPTHP